MIILVWLQMIAIILILAILAHAACDQTFTYTANDTLTIPYRLNLILSSFMSTRSHEYVSPGTVQMSISFSQNPTSTQLYYNIIYFSLETQGGLQCYQDYFENAGTTTQMVVAECHNNTIEDAKIKYSCFNLTNCLNENFTYSMKLQMQEHLQNLLILQNIYPNQDSSSIQLNTKTIAQIKASVSWFYGAVALTCLLLINLVVLTGVSLYFILKYRKVKRIYEQFRLTQSNHEADNMRSSYKDQ